MKRKIFVLMIVFWIIPFTLIAKPDDLSCPIELVKNIIGQALPILKETNKGLPQLKTLYGTSCEFFDKEKIASLVLAKKWNGKGNIQGFNAEEQKKFQEDFLYMLYVIWYNKINQEQEKQSGDLVIHYANKVIYQKTNSGIVLATVKTDIERNNIMIPVAYHLIYKDGYWLVYDIDVEGVGIVQNFRKQFLKFQKDEPREIIAMVNKKISILESNM